MERAIRLYVPLRRDEAARLKEIAESERRRPADQAALMLGRLLTADGTNEQADQREALAAIAS